MLINKMKINNKKKKKIWNLLISIILARKLKLEQQIKLVKVQGQIKMFKIKFPDFSKFNKHNNKNQEKKILKYNWNRN